MSEHLCVFVSVFVCVGMFGVGQKIFPFNLINYPELTCGYENLWITNVCGEP